jgi:hypothetical protein
MLSMNKILIDKNSEIIFKGIQGVSDKLEVGNAAPVQPSQEKSIPKLTICNPQSGVHTRRMEGTLAPEYAGEDPSKYCSPRNYRSHLNAELLAKGSQFLLGDAFFESSRAETGWREVANEIPVIKDDNDNLQQKSLKSPEEAALAREIDTLWPDGAKWPDGEDRFLPFASFIFGEYSGIKGRRYDFLSGEERQLLKNIILQVKALKEELDELKSQEQSLRASGTEIPQEFTDRIPLLENGLVSVGTMVRGHENACHARLQEILRTCANEIDSMGKGSGDVNSSEEVTKLILSKYRSQVCAQVLDPDKGLFFHKKHMITWTGNSQEVDFQARISNFNPGVRAGRDLEIRQAARIAMSGAWALNDPRSTPNWQGLPIKGFQFKDFVDPFVGLLIEEGILSLVTNAEAVFGKLSGEVRRDLAKTFLQSEITFEDYCTILGKNVEDVRKVFADGIEDSEDEDAKSAIGNWMSGTDKMSLENISENCQALDNYAMGKACELIPELFSSQAEQPAPTAGVVAKILFPAYLYHTGVLVRTKDVQIAELSESTQTFSQALLDKAAKRNELGSEEVAFCMFPETFTLHPSHADELFFEAQMENLNSCVMHSLNHFIGKPIFGSAELRGAQIISKCSTESATQASLIKDIRAKVAAVCKLLSEVDVGHDVELRNVQSFNKFLEEIKQKLPELNRAIDAMLKMVGQGEISLENNPLDLHAKLIQDIVEGLDSLNAFCESVHDNSWMLQNETTRSGITSSKESIKFTLQELKNSFSPVKNGVDPVVLRISLEKQAGVRLHTESGPGREIEGGTTDSSPEKMALLEALKRDELPNNVDRAIIGDGVHFRCVRKLSDGQWILLDSAQKDGPIVIHAGGLLKLLSSQSSYQIMYCRSMEDQLKLENFIMNA